MKQSLFHPEGIRRCYISEERGLLERHHVINGSLRDWAEKEGLWIYITPQMHAYLHQTGKGALIQKNVLKPLAEALWVLSKMPPELVEEAKAEWMKAVRKNYL